MNLNLIPRLDTEPKVNLAFRVYEKIGREVVEICQTEGIVVSALLRHLLNNFLDEYRQQKKGVKKND